MRLARKRYASARCNSFLQSPAAAQPMWSSGGTLAMSGSRPTHSSRLTRQTGHDSHEQLTSLWSVSERASRRGHAKTAIEALKKHSPEGSVYRADVFKWIHELNLNAHCCNAFRSVYQNGVSEDVSPISTKDGFTLALARLDSGSRS